MINEIIRQIDNNFELTAAFQKLTEASFEELELAKTLVTFY